MNPYDVLEVEPGSANAGIVQAAARALKDRRHDAKAIAAAQRALLDPTQRALADFLRPVIPTPTRFLPPAEVPDVGDLPTWPEADPAALVAVLAPIVAADRALAEAFTREPWPAPEPAAASQAHAG